VGKRQGHLELAKGMAATAQFSGIAFSQVRGRTGEGPEKSGNQSLAMFKPEGTNPLAHLLKFNKIC